MGLQVITNYFKKFYGVNNGSKILKVPSITVMFWSFLGAFLGISAVSGLTLLTFFKENVDAPVIMGSIGAVAILMYGSIDVPLAQPRNIILGNFFSGLVGVIVQQIFEAATGDPDKLSWLKNGLSVGFALVVMQATSTVHPPGGATALIAVAGGKRVHEIGFLYLALPLLFSLAIMTPVALIVNNIQRQYPLYWFDPNIDTAKILRFNRKVVNGNRTEKEDIEFAITATDTAFSTATTLPALGHGINIVESDSTSAIHIQRIKYLENLLREHDIQF